jgi:hypothetical protein
MKIPEDKASMQKHKQLQYHPVQVGDEANRFSLIQEGSRTLYVIGLNPSTANESKPDATMKKVLGFASYNGFDGFAMFNLCPVRATDPDNLPEEFDGILWIRNLALISKSITSPKPEILIAFGNNILKRDYLLQSFEYIIDALKNKQCKYYQIGKLTKKGFPRHPLYQPYSLFEEFQIEEFLQKNIHGNKTINAIQTKRKPSNTKRKNLSFPPEENEFMEIHWGTTPLGGDLSIGYYFDKDDQHCTRENMAYMNIYIYNKDGTYVNCVIGNNPYK